MALGNSKASILKESTSSQQTVLQSSVIKADLDPPATVQRNSQFDYFKRKLNDLSNKHQESMEILRERSLKRSARYRSRSQKSREMNKQEDNCSNPLQDNSSLTVMKDSGKKLDKSSDSREQKNEADAENRSPNQLTLSDLRDDSRNPNKGTEERGKGRDVSDDQIQRIMQIQSLNHSKLCSIQKLQEVSRQPNINATNIEHPYQNQNT